MFCFMGHTSWSLGELEGAVSRLSKARRSKVAEIVSGLAFDLECVVRGLRPGTLLNSLPFPAHDTTTHKDKDKDITLDALRALIDEMAREHRGSSSHAIRILNSDDCPLVVDTEALAAGWPMPRGIRFADEDVRWMNDSEQKALEGQLKALAALLVEDRPGGHAPFEDLETSLHDASLAVSIPTVYGYVLGYPCTYEVLSREHAASVSRWLSSATLLLYNCRIRHGEDGERAALPVLLSFSVPKQLVESFHEEEEEEEEEERCKGWLSGWRDGMVARAPCPTELIFDTQILSRYSSVVI